MSSSGHFCKAKYGPSFFLCSFLGQKCEGRDSNPRTQSLPKANLLGFLKDSKGQDVLAELKLVLSFAPLSPAHLTRLCSEENQESLDFYPRIIIPGLFETGFIIFKNLSLSFWLIWRVYKGLRFSFITGF